MEIFIKVMVWLFMSVVGIALTSFVGGEGKALSKKHNDRTLLPAVKLLLVILVIWAITAVALVFYQSKWYMLSIGITVAFLWMSVNGNPIEEDIQTGLGPEQQKLNDRWEALVGEYDKLIEIKRAKSERFMGLDMLPAPKEEMAEAIRFVYWFRLMELNPAFSVEELLNRYYDLANFIKSEDTIFINSFEKMFSPKTPDERTKAVEFIRNDPDGFEEHRARMQKIYSDANSEVDALEDAWEQAHESTDEE